MNNEQKNRIQSLLNDFNCEQILTKISNHYDSSIDLGTIQIGRHNVSEIGAKISRIIEQFKHEFESGDTLSYLPPNIVVPEFGSGSLQDDLDKIINFSNPDESEQALCRLIHYQITFGFWDKQPKELKKAEQSRLDNFKGELEQLAVHIKTRSEKTEQLIQSLNEQKADLSKFIEQKNSELTEIQNSLQTVRNNTSETSDLLTRSTAANEKINSIFELQQKNLKGIEEIAKTHGEAIEVQNKAFSEKIALANTEIEETKKQAEYYQQHLKKIEEKTQYFDERNKFLDELIGREVGASLFETFKQRKKELDKTVSFWKWAVLFLAIITVLWIVFLFSHFPMNGDWTQIWEILIINSFKTAPAIILLIFAMTQYKRERDFQEEYAFKSAVALTIDAYANRLTEPNRDKLIMESVQGVYKSPTLEQEKSSDLNHKGISGLIKELGSLIEKVKK